VRFLVDGCCPRIIVTVLRQAGHDVVYIPEGGIGATDDVLVALAIAEGRVVVTQDYDFGESAVRRGTPRSGVLLIACQALPPRERAARVARVAETEGESLVGRLTIIEPKRLRHRPID
jgi:predicted nuclease of predicted toxin-antitoxin system